MSASVNSSCCIPYQPLPAQPEPIVGGGPTGTDPNAIAQQPQTIYIQPAPIVIQQPVVVQQPAAPAPAPVVEQPAAAPQPAAQPTVTGGGPIAQGCCGSVPTYAPVQPVVAPPTNTTQPVAQPAPQPQTIVDPYTGQTVSTTTVTDPYTGQTVTTSTPVANTPAPPEPIPTTDPNAIPNNTPGSDAAWWPAWENVFKSLGADDAQLAKIKGSNLSDEKLAVVAQEIARNPASQKPGDTTTPGTPNTPGATTTPASQLATWSKWVDAYKQLGLNDDEIAKIGSRALSERQLAVVWTGVKERLAKVVAESGVKPTDDGTGAGTGGWTDAWTQKFKDLGFNDEVVGQMKTNAVDNKLTDAQIQEGYDKIAADVEKNGIPAGYGDKPAGGWSKDWTEKYEKLGVPKRYVEAIGTDATKNQLTDDAIQKSFDHIKARIENFKDPKKGDWYNKLKGNGMKEEAIWDLVLQAKVPSDKELGKMNHNLHMKNEPFIQKAAQFAFSMIPGAELVQYATGKHWITGQDIDRTDAMRVAAAALSGIAAFGAFRHVKGVTQGLAARKAVLAGTSPLTSAAVGEKLLHAPSWKAFVPFSRTSGDMVALGGAHRAMTAFYTPETGAKAVMEAKGLVDDARILDNLFTDLNKGAVQLTGNRNWILPINNPFKAQFGAKFISAGGQAGEQGVGYLKLGNFGWRANDNVIIANIANAAGERLGGLKALSAAEKLRIGGDLAGRAGAVLDLGKSGGILSKIGKGPVEAVRESVSRVGQTGFDDAYLGRLFQDSAAWKAAHGAGGEAGAVVGDATQAAKAVQATEQLGLPGIAEGADQAQAVVNAKNAAAGAAAAPADAAAMNARITEIANNGIAGKPWTSDEALTFVKESGFQWDADQLKIMSDVAMQQPNMIRDQLLPEYLNALKAALTAA